MASERQVDEMNARLIDIVQLYRRAGMTPANEAAMAAEIRTVGRWYAAEAGLGSWGVEVRVLGPVAEQLRLRYGDEEGRRLLAEVRHHLRVEPGGRDPSPPIRA